MAINVNQTGPYQYNAFGVGSQTTYATYSYFSGEITTTDSFEENILDFGAGLKELYIINAGANMAAFQFPEKYIATVPATALNVASGIVPAAPLLSYILFRSLNKRGVKLRSATTGAQTTLYVFGI